MAYAMWPFRFMGQCQLTYRGHARKAAPTIHLPKQPRVFSEASSVLSSGAEKSYSDLAAEWLIFLSSRHIMQRLLYSGWWGLQV